MKNQLIILFLAFYCSSNLISAPVLPADSKNKLEAVSLELWIRDVQTFIDANKPVAAESYMPFAKNELARIRMSLTFSEVEAFNQRLEYLETLIKMEKDYQMKTYGKLVEQN